MLPLLVANVTGRESGVFDRATMSASRLTSIAASGLERLRRPAAPPLPTEEVQLTRHPIWLKWNCEQPPSHPHSKINRKFDRAKWKHAHDHHERTNKQLLSSPYQIIGLLFGSNSMIQCSLSIRLLSAPFHYLLNLLLYYYIIHIIIYDRQQTKLFPLLKNWPSWTNKNQKNILIQFVGFSYYFLSFFSPSSFTSPLCVAFTQ